MLKISKLLFISFSLLTVMTAWADMSPIVDDGTIHEAFVSPISELTPLPVLGATPPAPVADPIPPQTDPQTIWIPGYWAWNKAVNNFTWVCGVWRKPPAGHVWVPGVWRPLNGGWVWMRGFWSHAPAQQLSFITAPPPDQLDENPANPASGDLFWVHGYWEYSPVSGQYNWLNGIWQPYDPQLILVPAHYEWRPNGFIFVPAYWDWTIEQRGTAYRCANPLIVLEPIVIIRSLYGCYPDHLCTFGHYWHFYPDWWQNCSCTPSWWQWSGWWNFTCHDHWALWWWWGHPGYPAPYWITDEAAQHLAPPEQKLLDLMKKMKTPLFVTPKGIPSSNAWFDAIQKATALAGKKSASPLVMPLDPAVLEQAIANAAGSIPQSSDLRPSGHGNGQALAKPVISPNASSVQAAGTVKVPQRPTVDHAMPQVTLPVKPPVQINDPQPEVQYAPPPVYREVPRPIHYPEVQIQIDPFGHGRGPDHDHHDNHGHDKDSDNNHGRDQWNDNRGQDNNRGDNQGRKPDVTPPQDNRQQWQQQQQQHWNQQQLQQQMQQQWHQQQMNAQNAHEWQSDDGRNSSSSNSQTNQNSGFYAPPTVPPAYFQKRGYQQNH